MISSHEASGLSFIHRSNISSLHRLAPCPVNCLSISVSLSRGSFKYTPNMYQSPSRRSSKLSVPHPRSHDQSRGQENFNRLIGVVIVTNSVDTLSRWMTSMSAASKRTRTVQPPNVSVVAGAYVSGVRGEIVVVLNRVEQRNTVFVGCQQLVTLREHVLISDWCKKKQ